ncbi:polyamine-modulated factor 1-like [Ptychodera flava]|uniref:polyamine-modulated factor 1-like n=1 Tax=Ptychodera flava TaxID=63121 RepID=UPI00396A4FAE
MAENTDGQTSSEIARTSDEGAKKDVSQCSSEHEGRHMFRVRDALHKTVNKCLEKTSRYSLFANNYKFAHKSNPQMLKSVIKQFNDNLKASIEAEFEEMIAEENLVSLCNDFDKLVEDASVPDKPITMWRPSGIPKEDLRAHSMSVKLKERENLKKELAELEQEYQRIQDVFGARTQHLQDSQKKVKERLKKWEEAVTVLTKSQATDLEQSMSSMMKVAEVNPD